MARIQQIKHPDGDVIYPISHTNAIIDDSGNRLENVLQDLKVEIVNNLTDGGTDKALSAEMGKELNETKQDTLVSGENIKTINGQSMLGEGDIIIEGGEGGGTSVEIVNDLTTGGINKALSAEMGRLLEEKRVTLYKMLGEKITMLCKVFGSNVLYDIMATFDVTSTTEPTRIAGEFAVDCFTKTYVDGVEVPATTTSTSTSTYTFSTIREHIVLYKLVDEETIVDGAFENCSNLTSVTIPDSVTRISNNAFRNCSCLTSITIPDSVEDIDYYAFDGCCFQHDKLVNNSSVTGYPWGALTYDIVQDDGLCINRTIAERCRPNATYITIPSNVTEIGYEAFRNCTSLISVTMSSGVTYISSGVFENCTSLTSVTLGSEVYNIGDRAFSGCSSLTSVVIPSGVRNINVYAFFNCTSLSSITCHATTAPNIGSHIFDGLPTNGTLHVPSGSDYSTWLFSLPSGWTIEYIT